MNSIRESLISAHHNYLINGMLTPGFVVGDPAEGKRFFFLADVVPPGENAARISARAFGRQGDVLAELGLNRLEHNPGNCAYHSFPGGFRVEHPAEDVLLEVVTQSFANGYLTRIKGRLLDEEGKVCMETSGESVQIHRGFHSPLIDPFG